MPTSKSRFAWLLPAMLLFIVLVVPLALFGKIADSVHEGHTLTYDEAILHAVHTHASTARDQFFIQVAHWGGAAGLLPLTLLIIIGLAIKKRYNDSLYFAVSVFGAVLMNLIAKQTFGRHRPTLWASPTPQTDFSFPSGHAMLSTAFFLAVMVLAWNTRWRWPSIGAGVICVALICFSRIYLEVHYPTDVVAGILASVFWVSGVYWLRHLVGWGYRRRLPIPV